MKKNVRLLLLLVLPCTFLHAQTDFRLRETTFVGAMGPDPADDWTSGWANFDPQNTTYPAPTDQNTLNGMATSLPVPGEKDITNTLTLDASQVYLLQGIIVVRNGGKLVIPAGTVIRAQADVNSNPRNYASILVERGGQIEILGTANNPVVITSNRPAGQRERGDWGGLLVAGRARHNLLNGTTNDNVQMEGFNNVTFDGALARFGGTLDNDNSGIIRYLRLEFPGLAFEANREINGLTLGAVGAATELHHVQVSYSNDDSFEWFGGSVNSSNLIAWKGTDDDFDTDNGYSGKSQFGIGVKDTSYYDLSWNAPSGASTSEGFESDNEASGTASVQPYTNAIFSNYTMLGPVPVGGTYSQLSSTQRGAFRRGARIRRNSSQRIVNSIFMGYRNFVMLDGDSTIRNTNFPALLAFITPNTPVPQNKQLYFANNLIVNTASAFTSTTDTTANGLVEVARTTGSANRLAAANAFITQGGPLANNINPVPYTAGTVLVNPNAYSTAPDFRPVAGSPALGGANFFDNPILAGMVIGVSTHEATAANYKPVFPNPITNGTLNFGRTVNTFGLFDANGKLLQLGYDAQNMQIHGLVPGVYYLKLDGQVQRVVVQ